MAVLDLFPVYALSEPDATDYRTQAGRHNWQYCNHWQSHYHELKSISEEFEELKKKKAVPNKIDLQPYREKIRVTS